jgi:dTDP-4-amino-4,6-dideoxygalactose transaminase
MGFMRNFGHNGPGEFAELGINGKNSEVHAAMGVVNLRYVNDILATRKTLSLHYDDRLKGLPLRCPTRSDGFNYAYYAVIFDSEAKLLKTEQQLNKHNIYPRRYFYPSLTLLPYVKNVSVPVCEDVSTRILCLPLYHTLDVNDIDRICDIVRRMLSES